MNLNGLYKRQTVNVLVALLIGIFVVFPDVIRIFDNYQPQSQREQSPHQFPPQHAPFDNFGDSGFPEKIPGNQPFTNPPNEKYFGFGGLRTATDLAYFFFLSWILLIIADAGRNKNLLIFRAIPKHIRISLTVFTVLSVCILGMHINSQFRESHMFHNRPMPWYFDGVQTFKGIFILVSVGLFSQISKLLTKQQNMQIENEKLKSESLQNRFEALAAQISPHFLFNSLNSLSGLVRENQNKKALKYISEISNLFRYILKGNWKELVSLREEMSFFKAYQYMLFIKYEDKINFDVQIDAVAEHSYKLPALSIQPLIENIIKHNIISEAKPMIIKTYIRDSNTLVVENLYQPKPTTENSTGIGLSNLNNRYKLLTGGKVVKYIADGKFYVELPLLKVA